MPETGFAALRPRKLVEDARPTALTTIRRTPGCCVRTTTLRRIDYVTALLDAVRETPPDVTPASVDVGWMLPSQDLRDVFPDDTVGENDHRRRRALAAVDSARALLDVSDSTAASILGVTRNTLRSWRRAERFPYPATVRRLMEVDSILRSAVALLGVHETRNWLAGSVDGRNRADVLGDDDGIARLSAELRTSLFSGAGPSSLPTAEHHEAQATDSEDSEFTYQPQPFSGPVRLRPRLD